MKIKALRVAEFGCFDTPVRVESFSGGLDVLAGPNELGKSTLLDALKVVFSEKLSTRGGPKTALGPRVPYGGGAPRIEVEFEVADITYRLRKQFLSKAQAELSSSGPGGQGIIARNDEVEAALEKLFGAKSGGRDKTGLLWLSQGASLHPMELKDDESNVLRALIERDVIDIGGGSKARRMMELIGQDLATLITRSRGQPTGAYKEVIEAQVEAMRKLGHARNGLAEAQKIGETLEATKAALKLEGAPNVRDAIALRVANAEKEFGQAREAALKLQGADARLEHLALLFDQAKIERRKFGDALEQLASLRPALAEGRQAREKAANAVEEARQQLDALEELAPELKGKRAALSMEARHLHAIEGHTTQKTRLEALDQHIENAEREVAALNEISNALKALTPVTADSLRAMESEERAIARLEDRLDAVITKVRVRYNDGVSDAIRLGGRVLEGGAVIDAHEPVTLDIAGVGQIEVDPGPMAAHDDMLADINTHKTRLQELLDTVDQPSVKDAQNTLHRFQELKVEKSTITARLDAVAPNGLDGLLAEQAKIGAILNETQTIFAGHGEEKTLRTREEIAKDEAILAKNEEQLAVDFRKAHEVNGQAQTRLVELDVQLRARQREFEALEGKLPGSDDAKSARLIELDQLLETQSREQSEAVTLTHSLRKQAPDGTQKAQLEIELAAARNAQKAHEQKIQKLQQDVAALSATQAQIGNMSSPAGLSALEAEVGKLDERVKKYAADIATMQLLNSELERATLEIRESYLEPVVKRIEPYFNMLFPGGTFDLSDRFAVANIHRNGHREEHAKLSQGTQEQISLLARLGFGRLLADQGAALPLILDDALIYSDDTRMSKMFEALSEAALHHQVLMLTCRTTSFEGLGGKRLEIEPGEF